MDTKQMVYYLSQYLNHCRFEKHLDPKTIKAYNTDILQYINYLNEAQKEPGKESLQDYIAVLHAKFAVKSIRRKIASLKAFFSYLEFEEILEQNPFVKIRIKMHEPFVLPKTIPLDTVSLLLKCAYSQINATKTHMGHANANLRDAAVLELLFATGIRISELCNLRTCDIDLRNGTVMIFGKGARERIVQIENSTVLDTLSAYAASINRDGKESDWFFLNRLGNRLSDQSVRIMINKYCQTAGITQHITPHMFRHSFATYLLEEDVDIRYIQRLLGHSSIVTTQIYTHVSSKKQRDILAAKHPRNKLTTW